VEEVVVTSDFKVEIPEKLRKN